MKFWILVLIGLIRVGQVHAQAQVVWPAFKLPTEIRIVDRSETIQLNGLPMQIQVFVSTRSPLELVSAFKESLGEPLVISEWENKHILGRGIGNQGEDYLTIQIE